MTQEHEYKNAIAKAQYAVGELCKHLQEDDPIETARMTLLMNYISRIEIWRIPPTLSELIGMVKKWYNLNHIKSNDAMQSLLNLAKLFG